MPEVISKLQDTNYNMFNVNKQRYDSQRRSVNKEGMFFIDLCLFVFPVSLSNYTNRFCVRVNVSSCFDVKWQT